MINFLKSLMCLFVVFFYKMLFTYDLVNLHILLYYSAVLLILFWLYKLNPFIIKNTKLGCVFALIPYTTIIFFMQTLHNWF